MHDENAVQSATKRAPWNKGKLIGPKPPLIPKHVQNNDDKEPEEAHGPHHHRHVSAVVRAIEYASFKPLPPDPQAVANRAHA
jgi:hypothetical protein